MCGFTKATFTTMFDKLWTIQVQPLDVKSSRDAVRPACTVVLLDDVLPYRVPKGMQNPLP